VREVRFVQGPVHVRMNWHGRAPKKTKMGEYQGNTQGGEMHRSRRDKMATHGTCSTQRARPWQHTEHVQHREHVPVPQLLELKTDDLVRRDTFF